MKRKAITACCVTFGIAVTCWSLDLSVTNAIKASLSSEFSDWSIKHSNNSTNWSGYTYVNSESEVDFDVVMSDQVWKDSDQLTNLLYFVTSWRQQKCTVVTNWSLGDGAWTVDTPSPDAYRFVAAWYSNIAVRLGSDNPQHALAFVTNIIETIEAEK